MRACSNCGSEIGSGDVYCGNCGIGQTPLGARDGSLAYGSRPAPAGGFPDQATAATRTSLNVVTDYVGDGQQGPPPPSSAVPLDPVAPSNPVVPPGGLGTTGIVPNRANETVEQKYMRQTRNATVFIAVVVGIFTTLAVIGTIWTVVHVSQVNSQLNGTSIYSNCESQGGTNSSC